MGAFLASAGALPAFAAGAPEVLPPVHVTASRIPVSPEEVGSAGTTITRGELERRQVRLLSDVLRDVPGLAVSRSGPRGGFTQLRIRGAEADHTLVLIDGIEVGDPAGFGYDFANLANLGTARIEILRGPQSALYGSDAIGGVVNVVTERPAPGLAMTGLLEGGSFGTRNSVAGLSWGGRSFRLSAAGNRFRTQGVSAARGGSEKDGHDNAGLHLKGGLDLTDWIGVEAVGIAVNGDSDHDAAGPADDPGEYQEIRERHGRIGVRAELFDGAWEQSLAAARSRRKASFFGGFPFATEGLRTKYAYQSDLRFGLPEFEGARHALVLAVEHEREELSRAATETAILETLSYVAELRSAFLNSVFLSVAWRRDDLAEDRFPHSADATTWRATAAWRDRERTLRIHGSIASGLKNPTLFELAGSSPSFMPNPALKPESAVGWDLGIEKRFRDGRVTADLTGFRNRIKDSIRSTGDFLSVENAPGKTAAKGIELTLRAEVIDRLTLRAAYTYTRTRDPGGRQSIRRPRHIASFGADARFRAVGRPAGVNLAVRVNGDQKDAVFRNGRSDRVTLGGYTLVDLSGTVEATDGVELFLRAENLLNEDYEEVAGYGVHELGIYGGIRIRLGAGKGN